MEPFFTTTREGNGTGHTSHTATLFPCDTLPTGRARLLIVDDEVAVMTTLQEMLSESGYEAVGLTSGSAALQAVQEQQFDVLLADLMMPDMDGIDLLRAGQAIDPYLVGIIMTGHGTLETAVEAMQAGAFDYLTTHSRRFNTELFKSLTLIANSASSTLEAAGCMKKCGRRRRNTARFSSTRWRGSTRPRPMGASSPPTPRWPTCWAMSRARS